MEVERARKVNLADFLVDTFPEAFVRSAEDLNGFQYIEGRYVSVNGKNIRPEPPYIYANSVDFLMKYLTYDFIDAVRALCRYDMKFHGQAEEKTSLVSEEAEDTRHMLILPQKGTFPYRTLFGHMKYRRIPYETVKMLVRENLLYQEMGDRKLVFVNKNRDYYEIMGTVSYCRAPYFYSKSRHCDAFWSVRNMPEKPLRHVCICLNAMEAVSFMTLEQQAGMEISTAYTSVGSQNNLTAMAAICRYADKASAMVFLAMRRDDAEKVMEAMEQRFDTFVPQGNSWSDDLMQGRRFTDPIYSPKQRKATAESDCQHADSVPLEDNSQAEKA